MSDRVTRRGFIGAAGTAAGGIMLASADAAQEADSGKKSKILAINCSRRAGETTAKALQIALNAAKAVSPEEIETELIELAGKNLHAEVAAGIKLAEGQVDDFAPIAEKLEDP